MQEKDDIKALFFNESTKHWHFEDLVTKSGLSRGQSNAWIKRLQKEKCIFKIKKKGKMPYYISNYNNPEFKIKKKLFALQQFKQSGFLAHLSSLKAETVILFGSFARSDWNSESDIDLFIYGNADDFNKGFYEKKLKREIQVFNYQDKKALKRLEPAVLNNIAKGMYIKISKEPFEVHISA